MSESKTVPIKGISGSTLKIIAIVCMALDHIGATLVYSPTPYYILRLIGRIAFPIFCFLLVEGFFHTKNLKKYCLRLALFALLSEIPFDLAFHNTLFYRNSQNVFFTLLIGLLTISCLKYCETALAHKQGLSLICRMAVLVAGMSLAWYLNTDYAEIGVLAICILYVFHANKTTAMIYACIFLCFSSRLEIAAFAAVPLVGGYNGARGLSLKYAFYIFYPAHLLLLYLIMK